MIKRILKENIIQQVFRRQVLIIQGPRQVGKTTLALGIAKALKSKGETLIFNCDDPDRDVFDFQGMKNPLVRGREAKAKKEVKNGAGTSRENNRKAPYFGCKYA